MSSASSASRLDLRIGPSTAALRIVFYLHLAAAGFIVLATPGGYSTLIAGLLLAASWAWVRRHPALGFGGHALVRLAQRQDDGWYGWFADGREAAIEILPASRLLAGRLLLRYRQPGSSKTASRVFFSDELDPSDLRRLRQRVLATSGL